MGPPKGQGPPPGSGLEAIDEGGRNDALLTHTRWLARPLVDGAANWQQALEVTRQVALDANDRFPAPLPVGSKVEGLALGVARYLWHNKGFTAPHNQARRGHKSGQARRKATETRDSTIRLLRRLGYSMTEIASRTNVDKSTRPPGCHLTGTQYLGIINFMDCSMCPKPIPEPRLLVVPHTLTCSPECSRQRIQWRSRERAKLQRQRRKAANAAKRQKA